MGEKCFEKPCSASAKYFRFGASLVAFCPIKAFCEDGIFHVLMPLFVDWKSLVTSKGPRNDSTMEHEEMSLTSFDRSLWWHVTPRDTISTSKGAEMGFAIMLRFAVIPEWY